MPSYMPNKDKDLQTWVGTFLSVAAANEVALGLTVTDLTPATTDSGAFAAALQDISDTHTAAKSATVAKDTARKSLQHDIRVLVKRIEAKPGVSSTLKKALGINPDNGGRTNTPPVTPISVKAKAQSNGVNTILWNRNGNIAATQFVVEAKKPADAAWTIVGQTTRSKFNHTGQTPGVALLYRVVAARADKASQPSDVVSVYISAS